MPSKKRKKVNSTAPRGRDTASRGKSSDGRVVDWPEVNRVLDYMSEHDLEEFEFAGTGFHIRLKRPGRGLQALVSPPGKGVAASPNPGAAAAHAPGPAPASVPVSPPAAEPAEELHLIKSPIVGTYYAAPNPGAGPFVKVGDQVSAGQALCIIEAMKLMNEIEADVAGEVVRIFAESGQPVEYGESLFGIRPSQGK